VLILTARWFARSRLSRRHVRWRVWWAVWRQSFWW